MTADHLAGFAIGFIFCSYLHKLIDYLLNDKK